MGGQQEGRVDKALENATKRQSLQIFRLWMCMVAMVEIDVDYIGAPPRMGNWGYVARIRSNVSDKSHAADTYVRLPKRTLLIEMGSRGLACEVWRGVSKLIYWVLYILWKHSEV